MCFIFKRLQRPYAHAIHDDRYFYSRANSSSIFDFPILSATVHREREKEKKKWRKMFIEFRSSLHSFARYLLESTGNFVLWCVTLITLAMQRTQRIRYILCCNLSRYRCIHTDRKYASNSLHTMVISAWTIPAIRYAGWGGTVCEKHLKCI